MTRDKNRTPMQWSAAADAGFSPAGVTTWLPVNPNYAAGINVADQEDDPESMLNYYRRLLRVRRASPALQTGAYRPLKPRARDYLAFLRAAAEQMVLVVLNYAPARQQVRLDRRSLDAALRTPGRASQLGGRILFSSHAGGDDATGDTGLADLQLTRIDLAPYEVLIAELG